jgi:hypothetical protein
MRYSEAIHTVDTEKAFSLLGLEIKKEGSYMQFLAPCGHEAVIRFYGEKKNLTYCPTCKKGGNIFQLALDLKGIDYADLVEKTSKPNRPIEEELKLNYELEFVPELEKLGLTKEFCERMGVGKPKGKTMLSGTIAFTVYNENGMKVAYVGLDKQGNLKCHKSFNPELYLYNLNNVDPREEAWITTDMFSCLRHLAGGRQCVCNFELPYLSSRQLDILSPFPRITFEWLFTEKKEIMLNAAQNLKTYHRFV